MVGGAGGQGGAADRLTTDLRAAYDAAAAGWADGPEQMYAPLARALVASAPVPLAGRLVLDLGASTGAAGRARARAIPTCARVTGVCIVAVTRLVQGRAR